jgi:cell surface protein SprA
VNPSIQIVEEEVWVQRQGTIPDSNEVAGVTFISLPPRGSGYDPALRNVQPLLGEIESGRFLRLAPTEYELTGDGYLGVITLNVPLQDQQIIGIAYRRLDGVKYGEFIHEVPAETLAAQRPIILKMIKPRNLQVNGRLYRVAWNQMLKNIYPIGGRNIKKQGFLLDTFRMIPGQENQNLIPPYQRLLRVLGLDNFNIDDTPAPNGDGLFDFRPSRTIDQARGEIIFPSLRPFDQRIMKYYHEKGLPPPDTTYLYPEVYDTTRTFAQQSIRNRYIIQGRASSGD